MNEIVVKIEVLAIREFPDGLVIIYRTFSVLGDDLFATYETFIPFDKEPT